MKTDSRQSKRLRFTDPLEWPGPGRVDSPGTLKREGTMSHDYQLRLIELFIMLQQAKIDQSLKELEEVEKRSEELCRLISGRKQ